MTIDVGAALDRGAGIPSGDVLLRFAAAAHHGTAELDAVRDEVVEAVGSDGLVEASLTVGAFNGLTRVADGTGIALDGGTLAATRDVRAELRLNDFTGARNTGAEVRAGGAVLRPNAVDELFRDAPGSSRRGR
jgi:hypothetical protein